MSSVNRVILAGNVGGDPKIYDGKNGRKVASFNMATSKRWRDKNSGERQESTQWHRVVSFFDEATEIIEKRVKKGSKVVVIGELEYRPYQDKEYIDRVIAEVIIGFGGSIVVTDDIRTGGGDNARPGGAPPDATDRNDYGRPSNRGRNQRDDNDEVPF